MQENQEGNTSWANKVRHATDLNKEERGKEKEEKRKGKVRKKNERESKGDFSGLVKEI